MAKKRAKNSNEQNPGGSVKQSPGITTGRREMERRIGSGNTRSGSAKNMKAAEKAPR